jgi:hypothetical protein
MRNTHLTISERHPLAIHVAAAILFMAVAARQASAQNATLPDKPDTLKFAVFGDNGTGRPPQMELARQMAAVHEAIPFEMVFMLGDNIYGGESPRDFMDKFETPYGPLIAEGVQFYAVLGNHDVNKTDRSYKPWNMNGERYYTIAKDDVRFFMLDTNDLDPPEVSWLDDALKNAREDWKICFYHHPVYSNARTHGSDLDLRAVLEPMFVKYGVTAAFSGHDHVYERIKPQKGISYFVSGAGGQLRKGDVAPAADTAAYFDQDRSFVVVEIDGTSLFFEAISRLGKIVDAGVIHVRSEK